VAGALIGMAASVVLPNIEVKDDVYADVAMNILPIGIGGLVLAAAVAAMMSTASGALIAAATVAKADVVPFVRSWFGKPARHEHGENPEHDVQGSRWYVLGLGVLVIALAIVVQDVVAALTIAYDILVGGLLIPILGGLLWKRGTGLGAAAAMAAGTVVTLTTMIILEVNAAHQYDGIYANEPIYYGLIAALVAYLAGSLLSRPTDPDTMGAWNRRVAGAIAEEVPVEGSDNVSAR
jgi:SSS family solute:Na+ symporter